MKTEALLSLIEKLFSASWMPMAPPGVSPLMGETGAQVKAVNTGRARQAGIGLRLRALRQDKGSVYSVTCHSGTYEGS